MYVCLCICGLGGDFTEEVCKEEMARISKHPLILPLSNPTPEAECTAVDAYTWTDGGLTSSYRNATATAILDEADR